MKYIFEQNKKPELTERITLSNIKGFIQGYSQLLLKSISEFIYPRYRWEQIVYRRIKAEECMNLGDCKVCGCEMLGKTMEDRPCEGGCYPEMKDGSTWNKFKEENKIKLFK